VFARKLLYKIRRKVRMLKPAILVSGFTKSDYIPKYAEDV